MEILREISTYLWVLSVFAGIYRWKSLCYAFRLYVIASGSVLVIVYLFRFLHIQNVSFYLIPLIGSVIFGLLYQRLLIHTFPRQVIPILVATIWVVILVYIGMKGMGQFQLQIICLYDIVFAFLSGAYMIHRLKNFADLKDPLFYLTLVLFVDFNVNMLIDLTSGFLLHYFSDRFLNILWNNIIPVYNFLKIVMLLLIIVSVKQRLPSLDKMPDFEK